MSKLPDRPSELILVALKDLAKCERSKKYKIDMGVYHSPHGDGDACSVCLAGSVMAQSLGVEPTRYAAPDFFEDADKLRALSAFCVGYIQDGLRYMGIPTQLQKAIITITPHGDGPAAFKRDMLAMAKKLKEAGL